MGESAVLINEFGEAGSITAGPQDDGRSCILNSGCLCLQRAGDMITALRDLFLRRLRGEVPPIPACPSSKPPGLADPAPIIHTLMSDPLLAAAIGWMGGRQPSDAVHGMGHSHAHTGGDQAGGDGRSPGA
jgi:G3E family GTPase